MRILQLSLVNYLMEAHTSNAEGVLGEGHLNHLLSFNFSIYELT